jgi:hypothetical protein
MPVAAAASVREHNTRLAISPRDVAASVRNFLWRERLHESCSNVEYRVFVSAGLRLRPSIIDQCSFVCLDGKASIVQRLIGGC